MATTDQQSAAAVTDSYLLEISHAVNTTLDLNTLLQRVAEMLKRIIDYEIFAILLLNEKTQELKIRFQVGHPPEVAERIRIKVGQGVTGQAAQRREAVLVNDLASEENVINYTPGVCSELAVPLIAKNKVIGVLDVEADKPNAFTEEHKRLLTLFASRIAVGIENARLYTRVVRQAKQLTLLTEISRELTSILNVDELFQRVADLLTRIIDYEMFSILLLDPTEQLLQHRFSLRFKESVHLKHEIPLGQGLVGYAAQTGQPVLAPDVSKDSRYIMTNPETKSELCVPLIYKGKVIGVLDIEHTRRNYFNEDHVRTLTTMAAQVAIAIENATLYERIARQEKRLEQDLALARELQFRLLPQKRPALKHAEIAARFSPARQIGGDLYDFLKYSGRGVIGIAVGDVSGKGAPAAIYAGLVSGIISSHALEEPSAAQMLEAVNLSLAERPIAGQYVSLIYAVWHDTERSLQVANSGLPRPLHFSDDKFHEIPVTGLPIGLFASADYDEVSLRAKAGDIFLFFSDGITDATSSKGNMFGRGRLEKVVRKNCHRSADEIAGAIFSAVADHAKNVEAFDDQTIVVFKVKGSPAKK
ncbi:MAG TPA: GAF domain-containing SpoIIE family protein phosphatase [Candidatus Angelobacter sp.]|jgi:sigma-B regulation protein RsbU (phosphoserine phosphatase)|nr:GAF domain-containing SpoIIE family protein phosphatase [Candidatus Angelobacter sp.]